MRPSPFALFAALALLPLAACDYNSGTDQISSTPIAGNGPPLTAQLSHAHHYVYVARGSGSLAEPDRAGLAHFIAQQADGRGAAVHVVVTGPVAATELAQLTRALVSAGVEPDKIEYNANKPVEGKAPGGKAGLAVVDVATERWRATLPNCPDHSRATMLEAENPDDSNFGCTSTNNLAVMVSDPRDLVVGETGGHTDAGLTSAAIDRLETDKTKSVSGQSSKSQ